MSSVNYEIAICDDEPIWQKQILNYCKIFESDENIQFTYHMFSSGEDLLKYEKNIDILLLDEEMSGISGLDIKEKFENSNRNTIIIFITSHNEMVYDSFGRNVYGFIKKPINASNLYKLLKKVIEKLSSKRYMTIHDSIKGEIIIYYSNIIYMEAEGSYTNIHLSDKSIPIIRKGMNDIEKELINDDLVRVHKSYIVNFKCIKKMMTNSILLKNGVEIPIARRRKKQIDILLAQKISEKADNIWNT
ncbi:LytR/AlgR family response regulator transcription factor [Agathobacter sp.]